MMVVSMALGGDDDSDRAGRADSRCGREGKSGELNGYVLKHANIEPVSRFAGGQSAQGCKIPHDT